MLLKFHEYIKEELSPRTLSKVADELYFKGYKDRGYRVREHFFKQLHSDVLDILNKYFPDYNVEKLDDITVYQNGDSKIISKTWKLNFQDIYMSGYILDEIIELLNSIEKIRENNTKFIGVITGVVYNTIKDFLKIDENVIISMLTNIDNL